MFAKYLLIFFVSMVPLVELRGSIVMAVGMDLDYWPFFSVYHTRVIAGIPWFSSQRLMVSR